MQPSELLRVVVVGGAVVATIGSASSNQPPPATGYYPGAQQQQQAPPPQASPQSEPVATATTTPCEAFCDRVVRCDLAPASDCLQQCRDSQLEQQQNGPAVLAELAQASCERLAEMSKQPAQPAQQPAPPAQPVAKPTDKPPAKRTQWMCNATGWWQKCETTGYPCYGQTTMMLGFGSTEAVARVAAETECNTAMLRLMGVNFTYHTSVTQRCRAISCSPPNAK